MFWLFTWFCKFVSWINLVVTVNTLQMAIIQPKSSTKLVTGHAQVHSHGRTGHATLSYVSKHSIRQTLIWRLFCNVNLYYSVQAWEEILSEVASQSYFQLLLGFKLFKSSDNFPDWECINITSQISNSILYPLSCFYSIIICCLQ